MELLGGRLLRARARAAEFVIESYDDLLLRRSNDAALGVPLLAEAVALPEGTPAPEQPTAGLV